MEDTKKIPVASRNGGNVFYQIPEDGILRRFTNGETKMIDFGELKKLQFVPGGMEVIKQCLIIKDEEALKELNLDVEPEYFYTEKEVIELLENGTLDQLEDTLNFAPSGVIDMIEQLSVKMELPDTRKRKLILEKTGFNIDGALMVNETLAEDTTPAEAEPAKERKATPITTESSAPKRKAAAPKYKVVGEK